MKPDDIELRAGWLNAAVGNNTVFIRVPVNRIVAGGSPGLIGVFHVVNSTVPSGCAMRLIPSARLGAERPNSKAASDGISRDLPIIMIHS